MAERWQPFGSRVPPVQVCVLLGAGVGGVGGKGGVGRFGGVGTGTGVGAEGTGPAMRM